MSKSGPRLALALIRGSMASLRELSGRLRGLGWGLKVLVGCQSDQHLAPLSSVFGCLGKLFAWSVVNPWDAFVERCFRLGLMVISWRYKGARGYILMAYVLENVL